MNDSYIHNLIVNSDTFDILSADSEFYNFMGERLYFTFEKFIGESDLELFKYKVLSKDSSYFIIKMYSQIGTLLDYIMKISPGPNKSQIAIKCVEMNKLIDEHMQLIKHQSVDYNVLNLYNDKILVYYPDKMDVVIYEPTIDGRDYEVISLEDFSKRIPGDSNKLISSLKNGESSFEYIFDDDNSEDLVQVRGMSIYNNGEFLRATGFIHKNTRAITTTTNKPMIDSLTGTLTKNEITNYAVKQIDIEHREGTTIAIIDIDYFKNVNDSLGHLKGDEVLRSISDIIKQQVGNAGIVGRFGGDEFFVVLHNGYNEEKTREILRSLKNIVNATYAPNDEGKPVVSLSIGCACYPKDADNYTDLFTIADYCLYVAKDLGRNRYIIYTPARLKSLEEIKQDSATNHDLNIDGRNNLNLSEVLCKLFAKLTDDEEVGIQEVLDAFSYIQNFQRVIIYDENARPVHIASRNNFDREVIEACSSYILDEDLNSIYQYDNVLLINNISILNNHAPAVYEPLKKQGVQAFIHIKFKDKYNHRYILSIEATKIRITWDTNNIHNYRLMAKICAYVINKYGL